MTANLEKNDIEKPDIDSRPFTAKDAAAYIGCSPRMLWALTNSGEIAHYRVGRLLRYERVGLDAYKARNRVEARNA